MYERVTNGVHEALTLANRISQHWNHEFISTEHMLLAIINRNLGVAACALREAKVSLTDLKADIEAQMRTGPEAVMMGKLPQTPRAKKVIEYGMEAARQMNVDYVDTGHLLLGLIREEDGVAGQVLIKRGLTYDRAFELARKYTSRDDNQELPPPPPLVTNEQLGQFLRQLLIHAGYSEPQMKALLQSLDMPSPEQVVSCGDVDVLKEFVLKHNRVHALVAPFKLLLITLPQH